MTTRQRYGEAVWSAAVRVAHAAKYMKGYVMVGEVAKEAGVSRVTARKYLRELVAMEQMVKDEQGFAGAEVYFIPSIVAYYHS